MFWQLCLSSNRPLRIDYTWVVFCVCKACDSEDIGVTLFVHWFQCWIFENVKVMSIFIRSKHFHPRYYVVFTFKLKINWLDIIWWYQISFHTRDILDWPSYKDNYMIINVFYLKKRCSQCLSKALLFYSCPLQTDVNMCLYKAQTSSVRHPDDKEIESEPPPLISYGYFLWNGSSYR